MRSRSLGGDELVKATTMAGEGLKMLLQVASEQSRIDYDHSNCMVLKGFDTGGMYSELTTSLDGQFVVPACLHDNSKQSSLLSEPDDHRG